MNGQAKFPRNQGRPIAVRRARREQLRWRNNPNNEKYPSDTFSVPMEFLSKFIEEPECSGVKFCNGLDDDGNYSPAMCTITEEGAILKAFDTTKAIAPEEFEKCRANWQSEFPLKKGHSQFFFLGKEAIQQNIVDFEVGRYEAAFVENEKGENTAVLFGYNVDGMKDNGDDPDTALNDSYFCPPICEPPNGLE